MVVPWGGFPQTLVQQNLRKEASTEMNHQDRTRKDLDAVEIGPLDVSEIDDAVALLVRGTLDNPNHLAVFGDDPAARRAGIERLYRSALPAAERRTLVARDADGTILGVMTMTEPGTCRFSLGRKIRLFSRLLGGGPRAAVRTMRWLGTWEGRDPGQRHWHCGPVAVEPGLQGNGIGSELLRVFCAQMDAGRQTLYSEADKEANMRFLERFGFEVIGEEAVLGAANWFMIRRPTAALVKEGHSA